MNAYRTTFGPQERQRAENAKAESAIAEVLPQLEKVYAWRWSRLVGGSLGVLLGGIWPLLHFLPSRFNEDGERIFGPDDALAPFMLGSVAASLITALVTYPLARLRARRALGGAGAHGPRKGTADEAPFAWRERRLSALEAPSAAMPMIATTAFTPLCLHLLAYLCLCTMDNSTPKLPDFGKWITISMVVVGHAHIALAICCVLYAVRLSKLPTNALVERPKHRDWLWALGIATLVSAVPGILLLGVPPLLSVATGLAFIPLMFLGIRRALIRERAPIDAARELALAVRVDIAELEQQRDELLLDGPRIADFDEPVSTDAPGRTGIALAVPAP